MCPVDVRAADLVESEDAVDADAGLLQVFDAALLPVEEDNGVFDDEAGAAKELDRSQYAAAGCDQVLDDDNALAGLPDALDIFAQAVAA